MTGTANRLTKWSDANTIANSIISDNGTTVSFTGGLAVTGTGSFTGNVTMNGTGRINNLVDPAADQDAATRKYVDDQVLGGASPAWSKYGNTVSGSNYMGSSNFADVIFKTNDTRRMAITAGGGIQLGTGVNLSTFTSAGVLQLAASLGVAYGGTGANTFTASQLVRMNAGGTALESSGKTVPTGTIVGHTDTQTLTNKTMSTGSSWEGTAVDVAYGGTGAATAAAARSNLVAAKSGANSDITSLSALSTALSVGQGGTGGTDQASAQSGLGLGTMATQGANAVAITGGTISNVTSLTSAGVLRLYSRTKLQLNAITPAAVGEIYYCSNCSPVNVMVSTGTAQANFGAITGGAFQ